MRTTFATCRTVLALDVGKASHWAVMAARSGEVLANRPVFNGERDLDELFASAPEGTLVVVDKRGTDLLFQLVSRRYERRSTIVTTNVGIGSWAKVFGDPVVASAIADRLCHHCHVLRITGRSYRTKDLAPQDRASPGREGAGSGAGK